MVEECTINVGFHSDLALVVGMNFGSPASTCVSSRISVQPNLRAVGARFPPTETGETHLIIEGVSWWKNVRLMLGFTRIRLL